MAQSVRLILMTFISALIGAGLMGCAAFSAAAGPVPQASAMAAHHHSETHAAPEAADAIHASHDGSDGTRCESCDRTVLHRLAKAPEKAVSGYEVPAPVFIIPATIALERTPVGSLADAPEPGEPPPLAPQTLTHQKISLLI